MGAVEVTAASQFVTGFILVDAVAHTDIGPLLHGDTLDLSTLPSSISVRAELSSSPGSVVFGFDGNPAFQTENLSPYALGGDDGGIYTSVSFSVGDHTIQATPYASADAVGPAGGSLKISFNVIE